MSFRIVSDSINKIYTDYIAPKAPEAEGSVLRSFYEDALQDAAAKGLGSIAFRACEEDLAGMKEFAPKLFTEFLEENEMEILFVVEKKEEEEDSGEEGLPPEDDLLRDEALPPEESLVFSSTTTGRAERPASKKRHAFSAMAARICEDGAFEEMSLDEPFQSLHADSFGKHLQQLINKMGLKNSEVYAAANISKQYFSKLLNDQVSPSKEKMLALAVGLRLNLDEATDLLRFAGYAFSPISQVDNIVEYFIRKRIYNVIEIDITLFERGLKPLTSA